MTFLRSRAFRSLDDTYSSAGIARLTGLSRGRVSHLHGAKGPDALPVPDGEGSTESRPLWRGDTVARWCAAAGRRLPPQTAPWLLPGPDGPRLRPAGQQTLHLSQTNLPEAYAAFATRPVNVHIARYTDANGRGPSVWLATALIPSETSSLLGWPRPWPHGSPLNHLVHEILDGLDVDHHSSTDLLGTLVLLPTSAAPHYSALSGDVRLLDLYEADRLGEEDLHDRLRRLSPGDGELADLVTAIGHRLPWWPPGCAAPALVAAWAPDAQRAAQVPPPLADAQTFVRRCESAAAELTGTLSASVEELGTSWWHTAVSGWRPGGYPDHGALPKDCDPAAWQIAAQFNLPPAPDPTGDFWEGLEWVMEHAPSRRLAQDAQKIYGDPNSAGTVVLDLATLPKQVRTILGHRTLPAGEGPVNHRGQRVLDALDAHPSASAGTVLGTWPQLGGPIWCATSPGTTLMALHVPRTQPGPATEDGDATVGAPLEIVIARSETAQPGNPAPVVGMVVTDHDRLQLLPAQGGPAEVAAAVEHAVWHPGDQTLVVGLMPSRNQALVAAVEALVETGPRLTPWSQLAVLVASHPEQPGEDEFIEYCPYCNRHSAAAAKPALQVEPQ
ncbi:hypothetical protein [Streptacidiphilus sp. PAMC 29251]